MSTNDQTHHLAFQVPDGDVIAYLNSQVLADIEPRDGASQWSEQRLNGYAAITIRLRTTEANASAVVGLLHRVRKVLRARVGSEIPVAFIDQREGIEIAAEKK